MTAVSPSASQTSRKPLMKAAIGTVVGGGVVAALLLGNFGRVDWVTGWVFVVFWIVSKLGCTSI